MIKMFPFFNYNTTGLLGQCPYPIAVEKLNDILLSALKNADYGRFLFSSQ